MKKNVESKLTLNKETVSNLELNSTRGGFVSEKPIQCCSMQCTGACPMTSENPKQCISF